MPKYAWSTIINREPIIDWEVDQWGGSLYRRYDTPGYGRLLWIDLSPGILMGGPFTFLVRYED